eukprot:Amastigsp_a343_365.p5 type:complete len:130 gc:universal Amastigsp_a343_365:745-356(-)
MACEKECEEVSLKLYDNTGSESFGGARQIWSDDGCQMRCVQGRCHGRYRDYCSNGARCDSCSDRGSQCLCVHANVDDEDECACRRSRARVHGTALQCHVRVHAEFCRTSRDRLRRRARDVCPRVASLLA